MNTNNTVSSHPAAPPRVTSGTCLTIEAEPDGVADGSFRVIELLTNPWIRYGPASGDGFPDGYFVDPGYFETFGTDHLVYIWSWGFETAAVDIEGAVLAVPEEFQAIVATIDGWWVLLDVWVTGDRVDVTEVRYLRGDQSDVGRAPAFPIDLWKAEALRLASERLLGGAPAYNYVERAHLNGRPTVPTIPEIDELDRVIALREQDGYGFFTIGEIIGTSESTARRRYRRALDTRTTRPEPVTKRRPAIDVDQRPRNAPNRGPARRQQQPLPLSDTDGVPNEGVGSASSALENGEGSRFGPLQTAPSVTEQDDSRLDPEGF